MGSVERAEEFAEALRRELVTMTEEEIPLAAKGAAFEALAGLVFVTPVDIGYAKSGWIVSFDSPSSEVPPEGSSDKSGRETIAKGNRIIESAPQFPHIWISNNVPYIEVLDDGRWAGEAIGEGEFAFGAGVNGPARRTGARGSIQAPQGILNPVFDDLVTAVQTEENVP